MGNKLYLTELQFFQKNGYMFRFKCALSFLRKKSLSYLFTGHRSPGKLYRAAGNAPDHPVVSVLHLSLTPTVK